MLMAPLRSPERRQDMPQVKRTKLCSLNTILEDTATRTKVCIGPVLYTTEPSKDGYYDAFFRGSLSLTTGPTFSPTGVESAGDVTSVPSCGMYGLVFNLSPFASTTSD